MKFEIEILQMEDMEYLYLVKFKRISGEQKEYKEISGSILSSIEL